MPARRSSAVDPTPTLSRRHAAGAPSARGLLFTLLGEFVLPGDGTAWTSAVLASFARLGIEEKTTRQALMRTAASGWLDPEKVGRRTRWRLTASAQKMLTEGADRIYSFTGPGESWNGRWLLVYARIPESDVRARHVVASRLSWAGFASLSAALWISPHPDREAAAIGVLREAASPPTRTCSWPGVRAWPTCRSWWLPPGISARSRTATKSSSRSSAPPRRPTSWPGRSRSCTPGGGSRPSIRCCRVSCCRLAGAA